MKKKFFKKALSVTLAMSMVMATPVVVGAEEASADLKTGLVAEYLFDGNWKDNVTSKEAEQFDAWGGYWTGTDTDPKPALATDTSRESVAELKGMWWNTGYISLDKTFLSDLDTSKGLTVTLWAKANNSKAENNNTDVAQSLLNFCLGNPTAKADSNDVEGWSFVSLDVSCDAWINDTQGNWIDRTSDTMELSTTEWKQVTMILDAAKNQVVVYVNGAIKATRTLGGGTVAALLENIKSGTQTIRVGSMTAWWQIWDTRGYMDDIRIYNKALSAEEVSALYALDPDTSVTKEEEPTIVTTIGAQVNTNDQDLGFVTTISKENFDELGTITDMGVIVTNQKASADGLTLNKVDNKTVKKIPTKYVTDLNKLDPAKTDNVYAFGSIITGITDTEKEFTAVPYIVYTDAEGASQTAYGAAVTRSISSAK